MSSPRKPLEGLQQSDLMYRRMINAVEDYAIFMIDAEGRVATWNGGARRINGYAATEIIGKHFSAFYTKEDVAAGKPAEALRLAAAQGVYKEEGWRVRKDESRFWAGAVTTPVYDPPGVLLGFCKVVHDMTERRQAQDQLLRSERIGTIGRVAAGVAHEFNNILNAVVGLANLILLDAAKAKSPIADAKQIIAVCEKAAALVRSLLSIGRRKPAEKRPVDLNELIAELGPVLQPILGSRIALKTSLAPGLPAVRADPDQLTQIIMNLCLNARDALGGSGEVEISTRDLLEKGTAPISHGFLVAGRYAVLSVRDSGPGLSPKAREHLFEPFFSTKSAGLGSGLGLSVVYHIAQSHEALIDVPEALAGAEFRFFFPAAAP